MEDMVYQSQMFFFVATIGFVILGVLAAILLFYLIRASRTFERVIDAIEKDVEEIGDSTKEMLKEVRDSGVLRFLFGRKKRRIK